MNKEKIKVGDIVTINWADETSMQNALILHVPQAIGDWWLHIKINKLRRVECQA